VIRPNDKHKVTSYMNLQTIEQAYTERKIPNVVQTSIGHQTLVVGFQNPIDVGGSPQPLQLVEKPADCALEGSAKCHWIESGQMQAYSNH
jgi:hypothetical protein